MLHTPDAKTKALLELADFMETLPAKKYDQREFTPGGCGTGGCIAYWACDKFGVPFHISEATTALGLDPVTAQQLFAPDAGQHTMMGCWLRGPTPQEAASVLRELAVTGDIPARWATT